MILEIVEGVKFGNFDTKEHGWYLVSREAPTPEEKEVLEDIPYLNGVLDFSEILGERIFKNREITYEFKLPNTAYQDRKLAERQIKSQLMIQGKNKLFDTHDARYYWFGKFKSIEVQDDAKKRCLIAKIIFDCYPFMYHEKDFFDDIWDDFNFESDNSAWTKWRVGGKKVIYFVNNGNTSVSPEVVATSTITLTDSNDEQYIFEAGVTKDYVLQLKPGINFFTATGNGEIALHFRVEVMG
ncbi:TPA: hypothetical protein ACGOY6_001347 [Streptococcus suis]